MPEIQTLPVHSCNRGDLTVFENVLPGTLKHISYLRNIESDTKQQILNAWQALICLQGACEIHVTNKNQKYIFKLNKPNKAIILKPNESYFLNNFSKNTLVLVLVSTEERLKEEYDDGSPFSMKMSKIYA